MQPIDFVTQVSAILEVEPRFVSLGATEVLVSRHKGRTVLAGTNGADYWIEADLAAFFPGCGNVLWAHGTYLRASLISEGEIFPTTGDPAFDETFIVSGRILQRLTEPVRRALLKARDLRPHVRGRRLFEREFPDCSPVHVQAQPPLTDSRFDPPVRIHIGEERFTPEFCARNVGRVVQLAENLETADREWEGQRGESG